MTTDHVDLDMSKITPKKSVRVFLGALKLFSFQLPLDESEPKTSYTGIDHWNIGQAG